MQNVMNKMNDHRLDKSKKLDRPLGCKEKAKKLRIIPMFSINKLIIIRQYSLSSISLILYRSRVSRKAPELYNISLNCLKAWDCTTGQFKIGSLWRLFTSCHIRTAHFNTFNWILYDKPLQGSANVTWNGNYSEFDMEWKLFRIWWIQNVHS